jgi:hypothetical protein
MKNAMPLNKAQLKSPSKFFILFNSCEIEDWVNPLWHENLPIAGIACVNTLWAVCSYMCCALHSPLYKVHPSPGILVFNQPSSFLIQVTVAPPFMLLSSIRVTVSHLHDSTQSML